MCGFPHSESSEGSCRKKSTSGLFLQDPAVCLFFLCSMLYIHRQIFRDLVMRETEEYRRAVDTPRERERAGFSRVIFSGWYPAAVL